MDIISNKTNRYQNQNEKPDWVNMAHWVACTSEEMYWFLAITMLMQLVEKKKIHDYWACNKLIATPIFSKHMTQNCYMDLLRYLHFNNNTQLNGEDKLQKLRKIINN